MNSKSKIFELPQEIEEEIEKFRDKIDSNGGLNKLNGYIHIKDYKQIRDLIEKLTDLKQQLDLAAHKKKRRQFLKDEDKVSYRKEVSAFMNYEMTGHKTILDSICNSLGISPQEFTVSKEIHDKRLDKIQTDGKI